MALTKKISTHNFYAFLWHAGFLALAKNFIDVDTIIPAMLIESGGEGNSRGNDDHHYVGRGKFYPTVFCSLYQ